MHKNKTLHSQCYDTAGPFCGVLPRFKCLVHGCTFHVTNPEIWKQLQEMQPQTSFIFFPGTVITPAFMYQVCYITQFLVTFFLGCLII